MHTSLYTDDEKRCLRIHVVQIFRISCLNDKELLM